jgi:hypothetical protein
LRSSGAASGFELQAKRSRIEILETTRLLISILQVRLTVLTKLFVNQQGIDAQNNNEAAHSPRTTIATNGKIKWFFILHLT